MAWVITQNGEAINLDQMTHLWLEDGTGRGHNGIAILKASEPGRMEDEEGHDRILAVTYDLCVVLGDSDEAEPLIRALLEAAAAPGSPIVDIADVVEKAGLELWHRMDHHP